MEVVGLTVGVVALYGTCLQAAKAISDFRAFGSDAHILDAQFNAERVRFETWGSRLGLQRLSDSGDGDATTSPHHPALDNPDTVKAVKELLSIVSKLCQVERTLKGSTGPIGGKSHGLKAKGTGAGKVSTPSRLMWSIKGKEERVEQVKLFGVLVQMLHNLVPPDGFESNAASSTESEPAMAELVTRFSRLEKGNIVHARRELQTWLLGHAPSLSHVSYQDICDDAIKKRVAETCDWILDRPFFRSWASDHLNGSSSSDNVLWIHGPAGFGKTTLSGRLVEHLLAASTASLAISPVVYYFFSSSSFAFGDDPLVAVRSWIAQIVSQHSTALERCQQTRNDDPAQVASRSVVKRLFQDLLQAIPNCTFILDGLDECAADPNGDQSIRDFLVMLRSAACDTSSRILIVSRDEADIRQGLCGEDEDGEALASVCEYRIQEQDVRSDIELFSRAVVDKKLRKSDEVKGRVSSQMVKRCEGQFQWIKTQGDQLLTTNKEERIIEIINETPTDLNGIYERNWARISVATRVRSHNPAISLLRWVAFARRPLTVGEISEVVLLDGESDDFPVQDLPEAVDDDYVDLEITALCGSLVEVRGESDDTPVTERTIHLTHFTIKEFLLCKMSGQHVSVLANKKLRAATEAQESCTLAGLCLQYISFPRVWQSRLRDHWPRGYHYWDYDSDDDPGDEDYAASEDGEEPGGDYDESMEGYFLDYATKEWHYHVTAGSRSGSDSHLQLANRLFDRTNPAWRAWRMWIDRYPWHSGLDTRFRDEKRPSSPLFYAAMFNLTPVMKRLIQLKQGINHRPSNLDRTPLSISCADGNLEIVGELLKAGAKVSAPASSRTSPLYLASQAGHTEIVNLLVEHGADPSLCLRDGKTPLLAASGRGFIDIVRVLIEKGADVCATDEYAETPLHLAARAGNLEITKTLIENGAQVTAVSTSNKTPLFDAVGWGHCDVVQLLIARGSDLAAVNDDNETLLHRAVASNHHKVAKILIDNGADVLATDNRDQTPLLTAVSRGSTESVELLIRHGANVKIVDKNQSTLLHHAVNSYMHEVIGTLISNGADIEAVNDRRETPLHKAVETRQQESTRLLIEGGANIDARTFDGSTPLHLAARSTTGEVGILRYLLDNGAKVEVADKKGRWPLHDAFGYYNFEGFKMLLAHASHSLLLKNEEGETLLHQCCSRGHLSLAELLLEQGAAVEAAEEHGLTPLHCACEGGYHSISKLLIDHGANVEAGAANGLTPLHVACGSGEQDCAKLLIDSGADVDSSAQNGYTCLHAACDCDQQDIVELLIHRGADVEVTTKNGYTPLHVACVRGYHDIVKLLIDHGANIETPNSSGCTALQSACLNGYIGIVKLLLSHNANPATSADTYGRTALFYAARFGFADVIRELLASSQADIASLPTAVDWKGATPLFIAVRNGHLAATEQLLQVATPQQLDARDAFGHTVLWWARRTGSDELVNMVWLAATSDKEGQKAPEEVAVSEPKLPKFDPDGGGCLACTVTTPDPKTCYICTTCSGFGICAECFESGVACRLASDGPSHTLVPAEVSSS